MNRLYRVIFNAVSGTWQAVSETARGPSKSSRSKLRQRAVQAAVVSLISACGVAHAQEQYWNGLAGGSGTWNSSATNWTDANGASNNSWLGDIAVFQGAAGDVDVVGTHGALRLQFITDGYRLIGNGKLNFNSDLDVAVDGGATAQIDVELLGSGSLIKKDGGTLVLNGANSYLGDTILNEGKLILGSDTALGQGVLHAKNSTILESSQAVTVANKVSLDGDLTVDGAYNLTLTGNISADGGLIKQGDGILTLSGNNSYKGDTQLNQGTLVLGSNTALGQSVLHAQGGTLESSQAVTVANKVSLDGDLTVDGAYNLTLTGNISADGGLIKQGDGILTLSGNNSYKGDTQLNQGTLVLGSNTALGQGVLYAQGGTLESNKNVTVANNVELYNHLTVGGSHNLTLTGDITGDPGLIKEGDGVLTLSGNNSYNGATELNDGTLMLGSNSALGDPTQSVLRAQGGILDSSKDVTLANDIELNNQLTLGGSHNLTLAGRISDGSIGSGGGGGLIKEGNAEVTLSGDNDYQGPTIIKAGSLRAGKANALSSNSAHSVAVGATLNLAGHSQTLASLDNSGSVILSKGAPGTVLKLTGPYVGNNGQIAISTVLNGEGSVTDKLLLSGVDAVASGTTVVHITNAGGLGAQTTGNGIEVIATEGGASLGTSKFTLAGEHVDAGAYEYRLTQTDQGAALHSTKTAPTPTPTPAYRAEVPLLSALPAQLRQADMAMLGDMRRRMGDEAAAQGFGRRAWGRVLRTDPSIRQQGTVSPESSGHMTGFQAGLDLYAEKNIKAGLYVGQLEGSMHVNGFASGENGKDVGFNRLSSRYLGLYGSWLDDSGLYADAVLQAASYRSNLHTADGLSSATTKGSGWLASLELGKAFALNNHWQIEPQAQLVYRKLSLDDTALSLARVQNKADDDWTLRLGARIKGNFASRAGLLQPYGRINIYKASSTTDVSRFITDAATTDISAKGGYTSTELAAGATLQLSKRTSAYGELGKLWGHGGDSRVKSGVQATLGVKVLW